MVLLAGVNESSLTVEGVDVVIAMRVPQGVRVEVIRKPSQSLSTEKSGQGLQLVFQLDMDDADE